jgi:hypothetical protein
MRNAMVITAAVFAVIGSSIADADTSTDRAVTRRVDRALAHSFPAGRYEARCRPSNGGYECQVRLAVTR